LTDQAERLIAAKQLVERLKLRRHERLSDRSSRVGLPRCARSGPPYEIRLTSCTSWCCGACACGSSAAACSPSASPSAGA